MKEVEKMTDKIYYRFSSDTGNGSMKMHINGKRIKMPSVINEENSADESKRLPFYQKPKKTNILSIF